jgi:hypothetical protein
VFNYKHYVPILKGKRAEPRTLAVLHSKRHVTPLIEAVPSRPVDQVPIDMAGQWPNDQRYFIDLIFLDDPDDEIVPAQANHAVRSCFATVQAGGQTAVPVTGLARSPGYQSAVKQVSDEQGYGIVLRLVADDFEDPEELETSLDAAIEFFDLERSDIDLILDAGSVADNSAGVVAQLHRAQIDLVPNLNDWRTLTVSASAFPLGLAPLARDQWNVADRVDWRGWRSLVIGPRPPARLPSFSDYAIAHPALPPEGRATILAQLRYAAPNSWLIWKGRNAFKNGFEQFYAICADLIQRPEYRGPNFSHGDGEIQQKANNVGGPGSAETWRQIGTNHHLETVLEQIANLP